MMLSGYLIATFLRQTLPLASLLELLTLLCNPGDDSFS